MLHLLLRNTCSTWVVEVMNLNRAWPLMEANALGDDLSE